MKKITFCILATLTLVSCRKDNDEQETSPSATIVGTWKELKLVKVSGKDASIISSTPATGCDLKNTYTFTSDSKFTFNLYSGTNCNGLDSNSGTYTVLNNGTILKVKHNDNSEDQATIQKLNQSELEIYEQVEDFNGDGVLDKEITYLYK